MSTVKLTVMIVEGQVHGGAAQGIGQALLEHAVYEANGAYRAKLVKVMAQRAVTAAG